MVGSIYEYDEAAEEFHLRATDHMEEEVINALRASPPGPAGRGATGRAATMRAPVQVPDILERAGIYAPLGRAPVAGAASVSDASPGRSACSAKAASWGR